MVRHTARSSTALRAGAVEEEGDFRDGPAGDIRLTETEPRAGRGQFGGTGDGRPRRPSPAPLAGRRDSTPAPLRSGRRSGGPATRAQPYAVAPVRPVIGRAQSCMVTHSCAAGGTIAVHAHTFSTSGIPHPLSHHGRKPPTRFTPEQRPARRPPGASIHPSQTAPDGRSAPSAQVKRHARIRPPSSQPAGPHPLNPGRKPHPWPPDVDRFASACLKPTRARPLTSAHGGAYFPCSDSPY